jgi:ABC-type spermidine/putrescine transport system permease subunit I
MPLILFKSDSSPWQVSWTETLFAFSQHWVPFGILSLYSSLNALEISSDISQSDATLGYNQRYKNWG